MMNFVTFISEELYAAHLKIQLLALRPLLSEQIQGYERKLLTKFALLGARNR